MALRVEPGGEPPRESPSRDEYGWRSCRSERFCFFTYPLHSARPSKKKKPCWIWKNSTNLWENTHLSHAAVTLLSIGLKALQGCSCALYGTGQAFSFPQRKLRVQKVEVTKVQPERSVAKRRKQGKYS